MTLPNYQGEGNSLYGTYQIRVHYYADHDDDENRTQAITWHLNVKMLVFLVNKTGTPDWIENSISGRLTQTNTENTSDFFNSDGSWSAIWKVEYPKPNINDYNVPSPPQNQLPR